VRSTQQRRRGKAAGMNAREAIELYPDGVLSQAADNELCRASAN
jgi:hypothetical protein